MTNLLRLALVGCTISACGGDDDAAESEAESEGEAAEGLAAPADGAGLQIRLQLTVPAGGEMFKCQYVQPTADAFFVKRWESWYSEGSHHLLLYKTFFSGELPRADVFDCASQGDLGIAGVAYASQTTRADLSFPEGVAMSFEPGTVLLYQSHYINATPEDIDADVRVNLLFAAEDEIVSYAGTLFYYDYNILIPGGYGAEGSASMSCPLSADINLVSAASHMHRRGAGLEARLSGGDLLYQSDAWKAPVPLVPDVPIAIPQGTSIDFTCTYANDREDPTVEGNSAEVNEMCIFAAFYYPKLPALEEFCLHDGGGPIFTGTASCGETLACWGACADGDELCDHTCTANVCAGSRDAITPFVRCAFIADCFDAEDGDACIEATCSDELEACEQATCD